VKQQHLVLPMQQDLLLVFGLQLMKFVSNGNNLAVGIQQAPLNNVLLVMPGGKRLLNEP